MATLLTNEKAGKCPYTIHLIIVTVFRLLDDLDLCDLNSLLLNNKKIFLIVPSQNCLLKD